MHIVSKMDIFFMVSSGKKQCLVGKVVVSGMYIW